MNPPPATNPTRLRHAQILVCDGGCCGRPNRGFCPVPLARLRARWKERGITPAVSLATTSCLGPCDVANVACIIHAGGTWWLGGLGHADYELLAIWAENCADGLVPLPPALAAKLFQRWQTTSCVAAQCL
jgi:hypothetical protein